MRVTFKETIWYEIDVPKETENEVIEKLKSGKIYEAGDLINSGILDDPCDYGEWLYDTSEPMSIEENDQFATIEAYNDKGEIIFANGKY